MAQEYKSVRLRGDVWDELEKYIQQCTPKPPARPPSISDAILELLKKRKS